MNAIEIKGLTKEYGRKMVVSGLELSIEKGTLFSLLGVNGAGKTTAIKMLSCLVKPDGGDALIHGYSINKSPAEVKKIIAVSPQETAVAQNLTVRENLRLMAGIRGVGFKKSAEKAENIIKEFNIEEISDKRAKTLSGGWQRRLSIAMALISEPKVLFLDEPTLGLDVLARRGLWRTIRELKDKMTVILTTHYLEEAEALSDKIGIMKRGRLVLCGTSEEIKHKTGTESFEDAFIKSAGEESV